MKNNTIKRLGSWFIPTLLFLTGGLAILKTHEVISLPWVWVISPIWVPIAIAIVFFSWVGLKFLTGKKYNM